MIFKKRITILKIRLKTSQKEQQRQDKVLLDPKHSEDEVVQDRVLMDWNQDLSLHAHDKRDATLSVSTMSCSHDSKDGFLLLRSVS
jgi:hypothetical protein